ncbi:MAG: alpha/beta hydrolase [Methanoregula sp.]|nr:alpha/beta hydrolase [Methanoregula sp.]
MKYPLEDEMLLVRGSSSFLLAGRVKTCFSLCIETTHDEYCQTLSSSDLVVVSAPEGGELEPAVMLIELVRTYRMPLLVLPKDHPGSRRIAYVVSAGAEIQTNCAIIRGTHPEQHLICASDELSGLHLQGYGGGVEITPDPENLVVTRVMCGIKAESK